MKKKKSAIDKNVFCKLDNKQNANLRSNVAFIETPWERLNSSIDVMPAKESMMILRPRSHGGGQGGHNLPLPVPRSPASRTFLSLCLPTPAHYCVSPVIM